PTPRTVASAATSCQPEGVTLLALGGSDCETVRDALLGQPVNSLSSLAYVAAGAVVLWRGGAAAPAASGAGGRGPGRVASRTPGRSRPGPRPSTTARSWPWPPSRLLPPGADGPFLAPRRW